MTRAQAETVCLLHAVGADGCPTSEVATRLGLSRGLANAGNRAAQRLLDLGLLELEDATYRRTPAGTKYIGDSLSALRSA
jgi:hypothetical protein